VKNRPNAFSIVLLVAIISGLAVGAKDKSAWKDAFITVGDIKIHYLDAGGGERTLVFIPGWPFTAEAWQEQIPYFAARALRVIALDPRSHGQTTKTEEGNTLHQQAADLNAFLQKLKIEHPYLVGWGAAATVIAEYIASPETSKPEKVVLVEGGATTWNFEEGPSLTSIQKARALLLGFQEDRMKAVEQFVRSLFSTRQPEYLIKEVVNGSFKTPSAAAISLYFDLLTGDRRSVWARMQVPSLIVTGATNRKAGEDLKNRVPHSDLQVIEGAGSAVFLDKPQAFNQVLDAFFGKP